MENKILYVCAVCTKSAPPLISLNAERKNILAAVTSVVHLRKMFLLMCSECNKLLEAVIQFKKIAVTGAQNLLLLKEKVMNTSKVTSSKPKRKLVILSKIGVKKNALPSLAIINSLPEDSTATSKHESTEAVDIKTEPESHIAQSTHSRATYEDLTEELHIKEEPEFETEPETDFETEPEPESKPDIQDLIASNLYPEASTANNNTDALNNFESEVNTSVGTSNIQSKTDQFEANIKIKSEPYFDESTDTCESDYGNEEDIILAALVKANAPTLAYLKGKDIVSPSRSKTSKAKPSKKKRKITVRKRLTKKITLQVDRITAR